jgi:hypothetical protein
MRFIYLVIGHWSLVVGRCVAGVDSSGLSQQVAATHLGMSTSRAARSWTVTWSRQAGRSIAGARCAIRPQGHMPSQVRMTDGPRRTLINRVR